MERRHQDGGTEDRLILRRLAADLADHLHPLLDLGKDAFIVGAVSRGLRLRLDIDGLGHDLSYSDYWHSDYGRRFRRRHWPILARLMEFRWLRLTALPTSHAAGAH